MYVDPSRHVTICIDGEQCFDADTQSPRYSDIITRIDQRTQDSRKREEIENTIDEELGSGEYFDPEKELQRNIEDIIPTGSGFNYGVNMCSASIIGFAYPCLGASIEMGYLWSSHESYFAFELTILELETCLPLLGSVTGESGLVFHHNVQGAEALEGRDYVTSMGMEASSIANVDFSVNQSLSVDSNGSIEIDKKTDNSIWSGGITAEAGLVVQTPGFSGHISRAETRTKVFSFDWDNLIDSIFGND